MIAKFFTKSLVFLSICAAILGAVVFPYPKSANALFWADSGKVSGQGCILGACVGDNWATGAKSVSDKIAHTYSLCILEDGPDEGSHPDSCTTPPKSGTAIFVLRDGWWRNGSVDLHVTDEVITSISWEYGGPFYLDF
jgi:hypothetical protein